MPGQFVEYNHSKIYFRLEGAGFPVVLVHGFGENNSIWKNQVAFLRNKFLLIIPDLPGSGQSQILPNEAFDPAAGIDIYAEVIKSILSKLNITKCAMIGHSMGGYITLAFAEKYPQLLQKFGLIHSSGFADNEEKRQARTRAIEFIQENGAQAFLKTVIPGLFSDKFRQENYSVIENLLAASIEFSNETIIQYYRAMISRPDRTRVFIEFKNPILFIIGEQDLAIPLDQSLKQCYQPAISVIHILPEVAHMGMLEEAGNCSQIIDNFLQF